MFAQALKQCIATSLKFSAKRRKVRNRQHRILPSPFNGGIETCWWTARVKNNLKCSSDSDIINTSQRFRTCHYRFLTGSMDLCEAALRFEMMKSSTQSGRWILNFTVCFATRQIALWVIYSKPFGRISFSLNCCDLRFIWNDFHRFFLRTSCGGLSTL